MKNIRILFLLFSLLSLSVQSQNISSPIGTVTSGTYSPTVDGGIGMGYVERKYSEVGNQIVIDIRGRLVEAEIVKLPFYKPF